MRNKWIFSVVLWSVLALGLGGMGCGDVEGTAEIPCKSDAECPGGLICGVSGFCISPFLTLDEAAEDEEGQDEGADQE